MTKQEMKDLVATKIKGQGNQVDLGSALADILNTLADNMGGGGSSTIILDYAKVEAGTYTQEEFEEAIGMTTDEYFNLVKINGGTILFSIEEEGTYLTQNAFISTYYKEDTAESIHAVVVESTGVGITIAIQEGVFSITLDE